MKKQADGQLTLFPADSPASPFLLPGSKEAQQMTVTSGRKCAELLRNSGPLGLLGKMLLESSSWHSTLCYLTWKVKATPAKRLLFRLAVSMPSTKGTGLQLWRTPGATDAEGRGTYATYEAYKAGKIDKGKQISLINQVKFPEMWPTPTTRDYKGANSPEHIQKARENGGNGHMDQLANAALYATPQARDYRTGQLSRWEDEGRSRNLNDQIGGQLNPDWVEWLMGVPVGWTDIDKDVDFPKPPADGDFWPAEPAEVPRVARGVPNRVDRIKGLGNMVVPPQFYLIYQCIMAIERQMKRQMEA